MTNVVTSIIKNRKDAVQYRVCEIPLSKHPVCINRACRVDHFLSYCLDCLSIRKHRIERVDFYELDKEKTRHAFCSGPNAPLIYNEQMITRDMNQTDIAFDMPSGALDQYASETTRNIMMDRLLSICAYYKVKNIYRSIQVYFNKNEYNIIDTVQRLYTQRIPHGDFDREMFRKYFGFNNSFVYQYYYLQSSEAPDLGIYYQIRNSDTFAHKYRCTLLRLDNTNHPDYLYICDKKNMKFHIYRKFELILRKMYQCCQAKHITSICIHHPMYTSCDLINDIDDIWLDVFCKLYDEYSIETFFECDDQTLYRTRSFAPVLSCIRRPIVGNHISMNVYAQDAAHIDTYAWELGMILPATDYIQL